VRIDTVKPTDVESDTEPAMKKSANLLLLFVFFSSFGLLSEKTWGCGGDNQTVAMPDFRDADGWFGADDAYSIPLGDDKSVWLFGDAFVGDREAKLRSENKAMVRNSVGISTCHPGSACTIQYFWQKQYTPKPRSFFDTGTDDLWYWPLDAFRDGKKLYVSLLAVRNKPNAGSEAFGFEIAGTKLAIVSNVLDSPDRWHVKVSDLTGEGIWPGPAIIADGKYVLWYTQVVAAGDRGFMTVLRVPKNKMSKPSASWEYLKSDGTWSKGLPGRDAVHVIDQAISEMSVRYHPSIHKWIAIVPGPGFPTPEVDVRTADSAIGPWSPASKLFEFPEMKKDYPGFDKDTFCYATKEHTEFSESKIALTYACNSMVVAKVIANDDLYRPRPVILDLPH